MSRSNKRKGQKRSLLFIGFSIFLLIVVAYFLKNIQSSRVPVYYMTEDWNGDPKLEFQKNAPKRAWYCPNLQTILKKVQKYAPIEKIEVANKNNRSFGLVMKLADTGPYLGVDADESVTLILKPNSLTGLRSAFTNTLLPKLFDSGFVTESKAETRYTYMTYGTEQLLSDEGKDIQYFHTGLKKDGYVYILRYEENEQHSIGIDCGKIDDVDSALLASVASIAPYSDWKANTLVQAWDQKDKVINLNVTQIEGGSGSGEWWTHNADESWTLLASGQDDPDCYKFEKRKVGKGIDCYKAKKSGEFVISTVSY